MAKVSNKLKGLFNIRPRYVVHQLCRKCDPCHDCMILKPHTMDLKFVNLELICLKL